MFRKVPGTGAEPTGPSSVPLAALLGVRAGPFLRRRRARPGHRLAGPATSDAGSRCRPVRSGRGRCNPPARLPAPATSAPVPAPATPRQGPAAIPGLLETEVRHRTVSHQHVLLLPCHKAELGPGPDPRAGRRHCPARGAGIVQEWVADKAVGHPQAAQRRQQRRRRTVAESQHARHARVPTMGASSPRRGLQRDPGRAGLPVSRPANRRRAAVRRPRRGTARQAARSTPAAARAPRACAAIPAAGAPAPGTSSAAPA